MADNDVFSPDPVELDLGFNDLVGDDKKYKDPDALAKAYANIERHARTLEAENAKARAELDTLQATNHSAPSEPPRQEPPKTGDNREPAPSSPPRNEDDFRSQIKEEIRALNEQERGVNNIETTARKMIEVYGNESAANEAIRKRAKELDVSVDWLRDSAARSPSAFYASMGIPSNGGTDRSTPAPNNEVNFRGGSSDRKNFEYFDRIRKDDPKLYFSAATQREMMNQAREMGADFYKR